MPETDKSVDWGKLVDECLEREIAAAKRLHAENTEGLNPEIRFVPGEHRVYGLVYDANEEN